MECIRWTSVKLCIPMFLLIPYWTKWPPFRRGHFQIYLTNKTFCISIRISPRIVLKDAIYDKPEFDQIVAWCLTGTRLLPETMLIQYIDLYIPPIFQTQTQTPNITVMLRSVRDDIVCWLIIIWWHVIDNKLRWQYLPMGMFISSNKNICSRSYIKFIICNTQVFFSHTAIWYIHLERYWSAMKCQLWSYTNGTDINTVMR